MMFCMFQGYARASWVSLFVCLFGWLVGWLVGCLFVCLFAQNKTALGDKVPERLRTLLLEVVRFTCFIDYMFACARPGAQPRGLLGLVLHGRSGLNSRLGVVLRSASFAASTKDLC